jgi:hypothetical protein
MKNFPFFPDRLKGIRTDADRIIRRFEGLKGNRERKGIGLNHVLSRSP